MGMNAVDLNNLNTISLEFMNGKQPSIGSVFGIGNFDLCFIFTICFSSRTIPRAII